ncbi:expressed protein [Phakopsora pachyrhizi]|uniref:Expressed protein n=1 Tax=Phakopsora pachyrhizi TaxID=170000 RepID=A0AAV0BEU2_PHAPC|nr:expressed protein [Phakopsora pachyrhizi]
MIEKRKKMLVAYRDVQNNFQLLMKYQKSFSPPILLNIKETVGYINLLNRFWLEEMLAIKLKHRSVQIEPIGNLAKLNGSDFWINAIKKIIWANLKNLTTIAALDYPMEIIFSRLMLSAVECLLQQSFITNKESLELFRNERALDLLENKIKNVFYQTWNFNSLVFSIDFVNSLVKHPELCTVTSILHSLQATEIKHIIKFVLRSFSELYRFKQLIETSQMDRLIESYETLTNVNYDMEDWFKEHNNFNYINNIQQ